MFFIMKMFHFLCLSSAIILSICKLSYVQSQYKKNLVIGNKMSRVAILVYSKNNIETFFYYYYHWGLRNSGIAYCITPQFRTSHSHPYFVLHQKSRSRVMGRFLTSVGSTNAEPNVKCLVTPRAGH